MKKTLMMIAILTLALAVSAFAADKTRVTIENQPSIGGNEPLPDVPYYPSDPGLITDSPGEIVGSTQYDYQSNGSSGHRIVVDSQGGVHFAWMNGTSYPSSRQVDFNYVDGEGNWLVPEQGVVVSQANGAGYVQLGLTSDNLAVVAYHQWNLADYVVIAVDNFPGMGIFSYFDPPDMLGQRCYWPYVTVDRNDNIHIVSQENTGVAGAPQAIGYTRSIDGGATWSTLANVDTLMTISQVVVSSPVSDKVAIAYTHGRDDASQFYNDIFYIESEDGLAWSWRTGKVNVTQYGGAETFWAYTDMAAIYDYNDNLNLIWTTLTSVDDALFYPVTLFHYSTGSQAITEITAGSEDWDESCATGAWNLPIAKMSLGVNEATNAIYAVYTEFDLADCSAAGYTNGDIWMNYSVDGGASWSEGVNMTDSQTPGCPAGECDSDHWSSVAEKVDDNLHIVYINDKDAGGIAQTEGAVTDNPVMYLEYPNPVSSIDDRSEIPINFTLAQNYPNPFNAETNIGFELKEQAHVTLAVYDITGSLVTVLLHGNLDAGIHAINWKADDAASGIYYYSLSTNSETSTKKMVLLK